MCAAKRDALLARICGELECAPVQHLGKLLIVWKHNPELHREADDNSKPRHARVVRRLPVKSPAARDEKSSRSRLAPPAGAATRTFATPAHRHRFGNRTSRRRSIAQAPARALTKRCRSAGSGTDEHDKSDFRCAMDAPWR